MKYRIKPYGCTRWIVYAGMFPFQCLLKETTYSNGKRSYKWTWDGFVSSDWMCEYVFSSVDEAKEAIKASIIQQGICLAHERQAKKRMKLHAKEKTVVVPPWK